jgi:predicted ferric reductase
MPKWVIKRSRIFLAFFLLNLGVIGALWWSGSSKLLGTTAGNSIAVGRLMGLIAEYLILVQLTLVGRIKYVEQTYGFDKLNYYHRRLGYYILAAVLIHPSLLIFGYATLTRTSVVGQFITFFKTWEDVAYAIVALIMICVIVGITVVRKRFKYETWYFTHLGIYVAIALLFQHQTNFADVSKGAALWYWLALNYTIFGLVLLYRALRPIYLYYKHRFKVLRIHEEGPGIYSVYINGQNMAHYKFEAGQYANLTFIRKGLWFTHPFSFSQVPNGRDLRFTIKGSGDFTNQIKKIKSGTSVVVEGPLGAFTKRQASKDKFLLIAGGIGITPIRALTESLVKKDIKILYSANSEAELVFKEEFESFDSHVDYFITHDRTSNYPRNRIDLETISSKVPDYGEREIYICGPQGMIRSLNKQLRLGGVSKNQIHYELFAY